MFSLKLCHLRVWGGNARLKKSHKIYKEEMPQNLLFACCSKFLKFQKMFLLECLSDYKHLKINICRKAPCSELPIASIIAASRLYASAEGMLENILRDITPNPLSHKSNIRLSFFDYNSLLKFSKI